MNAIISCKIIIAIAALNQGQVTSSRCECPQGHYLVRPCSSFSQPECAECPPGTFSDEISGAMSCQDCDVACKQREWEVRQCTKNSNLLCQCMTSTYRKSPGVCSYHTPCLAGYGVKQAGNHINNTSCEACRPGTFSPSESLTQRCRPCTLCPQGYEREKKCSTKNDTVCKLKECGEIETPQNGYVIKKTGSHQGDTVTFGCNSDYFLSGPPIRTCHDGKWTGWEPSCQFRAEAAMKQICEELRKNTAEVVGLQVYTIVFGVVTCFSALCIVVLLGFVVLLWKSKSKVREETDKTPDGQNGGRTKVDGIKDDKNPPIQTSKAGSSSENTAESSQLHSPLDNKTEKKLPHPEKQPIQTSKAGSNNENTAEPSEPYSLRDNEIEMKRKRTSKSTEPLLPK